MKGKLFDIWAEINARMDEAFAILTEEAKTNPRVARALELLQPARKKSVQSDSAHDKSKARRSA